MWNRLDISIRHVAAKNHRELDLKGHSRADGNPEKLGTALDFRQKHAGMTTMFRDIKFLPATLAQHHKADHRRSRSGFSSHARRGTERIQISPSAATNHPHTNRHDQLGIAKAAKANRERGHARRFRRGGGAAVRPGNFI